MTIEEYTQTIFPLIEFNLKQQEQDPKGYKDNFTWYLYCQSFYGFTNFFRNRIRISEKVHEDYVKENTVNIREFLTKYSGLKGKYIQEHMYTGTMFRKGIELLYKNQKLNVENIVILVNDNYSMAWITKEENKRLPKSCRGDTLSDAEKVYVNAKIKLIVASSFTDE